MLLCLYLFSGETGTLLESPPALPLLLLSLTLLSSAGSVSLAAEAEIVEHGQHS